MMKTHMVKKILSLDGGGIKGVFIASLLAEIEEKRNLKICDYFDLIAGTSTGGIIAAALALGMSARTVEKLYTTHAKDIFPQKSWRCLFRIWGGKYSSKPLESCLKEQFGSLKISNCKTRLLIPSFNLSTCKPQVFKTSHSPDLEFDYQKNITEVLMNTTAAPTFLNPNRTSKGVYVDGGIGANNPSGIAVVEGLTRCGWKASDIRLFSIGCTKDLGNVTTGKEKMGFLNVARLIDSFMAAESEYSSNIAKLFIGGSNYLRINPIVPSKVTSLDKSDSKSIDHLKQLGFHEAKKHMKEITEIFLQEKKGVFVPSHKEEL